VNAQSEGEHSVGGGSVGCMTTHKPADRMNQVNMWTNQLRRADDPSNEGEEVGAFGQDPLISWAELVRHTLIF
jgi:hypothetical protein